MIENRRRFLQLMAMSAAAAPFVRFGGPNFALAADTIVSLGDPTAKALGYYHDATKVDLKKWPKKAGPEGAKQLCSNCRFIQGEAKAIDGQEGKWIGCQLFPGKLVNEAGWCNSWFAKEAA